MLHNLQRACISGTSEFCEYEKQTSGIGHVWLKAELLNQISPGTDTKPVTQSGQCLILTNVPPLCGSCSEKTKPFIISFFLYEMPCPGFWLLNLFFGVFFTLLIVHFFVGLVTRQLHLSEFALVLISYISLKLCIFVLLEH